MLGLGEERQALATCILYTVSFYVYCRVLLGTSPLLERNGGFPRSCGSRVREWSGWGVRWLDCSAVCNADRLTFLALVKSADAIEGVGVDLGTLGHVQHNPGSQAVGAGALGRCGYAGVSGAQCEAAKIEAKESAVTFPACYVTGQKFVANPVRLVAKTRSRPTKKGKVDSAGTSTSADSCSYTLSPVSRVVPSGGGDGYTIDVTTSWLCSWEATSSDSWLTVLSGGGVGLGSVNYRVGTNLGTTRTAKITVPGPEPGQVHTVTQQSGCLYSGAPPSEIVPSGGGSGYVVPRECVVE